MRVEASSGQAVELSNLPVEDASGNEAAQGADASGRRAGGVAQLRLPIGGCRDDRIGDDGRVIAVRHGTLQVSRALADRRLADDVLEQGIQNALALLGAQQRVSPSSC